MTSSTTQQERESKVTTYWEKMGKLNLLMGTINAQDQKKGLEQARKNQEAEASAVRKNVWEWEEPDADEDDMGDQIVLGDIRTIHNPPAPTPPPAPSPTSSLAKTLAGFGLAAAGLGAGAALPIAAYQMFKPDPPGPVVVTPPSVDTDTDTKYGLKIYRDEQQE